MSGSYRQCTECGKRALSIATRCPGCGRELPAPAVPEHGGVRELGGIRTPQGIAVAVAIVAVIASARLGRGTESQAPREEEESSFISPAAPADFAGVVATVSTSAPAGRASVMGSAAGAAPELKVARTWTHVRKSRSRSAMLEAVLLPGDTVVADSLGKGWYRVALEGEVLGYAHASTLAAAGPMDPN